MKRMMDEKQFSLDDYQINVVGVRLVRERTLTSRKPITSPMDAVDFIGRDLAEWDREAIIILNLDNQNNVVKNMSLCSVGTTNFSVTSIRELLKTTILSNATGILIMHNHPSLSDVISPSQEDVELTENFVSVCNLLSVTVLDHIIVGNTGKFDYYSFKENGMLRPSEKVFQIVDDTKKKRKTASVAETKLRRRRGR